MTRTQTITEKSNTLQQTSHVLRALGYKNEADTLLSISDKLENELTNDNQLIKRII